jgi:hypothetical protein
MTISVGQTDGNGPRTKTGTKRDSGKKSSHALYKEAHDAMSRFGLISLTFSVFSSVLGRIMSLTFSLPN